MIAAPIPENDFARLDALHSLNLLDTPPEERFDRIIRLVKLIFQVPMAFLSLVDRDRQWFKAACGMPARETPRAVSFCGYTILSDQPFVIPDTLEDERFRDNPQVTRPPFIRFYAGYPLLGPGGQRVGSLCLADTRPRTLRKSELQVLAELARVVEREMGLYEAVQLQRALIDSQNHLSHELVQASRYVRSLLPEPTDGAVRTRWRFEPSSALGGDSFGYDWIDPDHFAVYLLDVSGHGVGAALLSVSVANALRSRSLPDTDFLNPSTVLARLNDTFEMDRHDEKYFTIWYGVFNRQTRRLTYATGGHPPALLLTGPSPQTARPIELGIDSFGIGMIPAASFASDHVTLGTFARLYVYSDGVYEIRKSDGSMMKRAELTQHLALGPEPDEVWPFIQRIGGSESLADDFSLLEVDFA